MKLQVYDLLHAYAILINLFFICVDCQCLLPFTNGTWISSSRGTWTIPENRTEIQNFKATLAPTQTTHDLTCISASGNQYILGVGSGVRLFDDVFVNSYTCIEIRTTSHSPSKYELYFITDIDITTGEPFSSNVSGICEGTAEETAPNTNILVADGIVAETVKETLPNIIRGDYSVTITDQNGLTSNQTLLGSCNDTSAFYFTEIVNATQAPSAVGFSESGVLYNMKSFTTNGVTYIYTYNSDMSLDSLTTYRFACWAVVQASESSQVYATVYPEVCQDSQNATYVPSGGQALILEPSVTCPDIPEESGLSAAVIAIIVLICVLVLVAIVIVIIFCIRKKKREDQSKSNPENAKEDTDSKQGRKGMKRPKSGSDLDSARLINERNKQKLAKKLAKKKETRTVAVQASIWTAPIKRTTTALKESTVKRSESQSSMKFISYIDKPVIKTNLTTETRNSVPRSNTMLENTTQDNKQPTITRSKTTVDRDGAVPRPVPKYLVKKNKISSPRQNLIRQVSEIASHSTDHYAIEFEKRFPYPNEGNPNEYHNTLEIPDEIKRSNGKAGCENSEQMTSNLKKKDGTTESAEPQNVTFRREHTKTSVKSRPSTTDGILGVQHNQPISIRKTNSEKMNRSQTIMKFSYNSPYGMSESQREYLSQKAAWVRRQVQKDMDSKKHIEEMRKLEGQRAFDKWIRNKRKSITSVRRQFSKTSSRASRNNTSFVENSNQSP